MEKFLLSHTIPARHVGTAYAGAFALSLACGFAFGIFPAVILLLLASMCIIATSA